METNESRVLIVDDEAAIRDVLSASLKDEGFIVETASGGEEGLQKLSSFQPQVVLLDIWMPGSMDGLDVLKASSDFHFQGDFVVMSGHGTIETAVKATKLGAWDFVEKPLSIDKITILLSNLLAFQKEKAQKQSILNKLRQNFSIIGQSEATMNLKETLAKVASQAKPVLLTGEMGAGKELIAQHIHYFSPRAYGPFIDLNCAASSKDLIEADIFGHEAGHFVGTTEAKLGKIELAHEGTLLLKEVEALDTDLQAKILKYLQEQKLSRLGGKKIYSPKTRIFIATDSNLEKEVAEGRFLSELYEYLKDTHIHIPALRERKEDIQELVEHFARTFEKLGAYRPKTFSEEAILALKEHEWPGNVRELKNFIERVFILVTESEVGQEQVQWAGLYNREDMDRMFDENATLRDARSQFEKEFILKKLEENDGNISKTAESIGVERSHLHRKIKSFGIDV
mgnify:CR=1 FL=1